MLKNLVGVVTGGASGLGKAAAKALTNQGCKITICDLPNSAGMEVAKTLGPDASFAPADIRSAEGVELVFDDIKRRFNKIDFVINCAGISAAHKIYNVNTRKAMSVVKIQRVLETNLFGTINVTRVASLHMCDNPRNSDGLSGTIVNVAGIEAFEGEIGQVLTAATSGAIVSMTKPLSLDLSDIGVRVVCICVGLIDTPLFDFLPNHVKAHLMQSCTLPKRFGSPEEFGHAVRFALENTYLNGCVIRLDGGLRHMLA